MVKLYEEAGVTVNLPTDYHAQATGQVEQAYQEVSHFLCTSCTVSPEDWSQFIPWAKYSQNSLHHLATNLTLFQCVLGYQPPLFPWNTNPTDSPTIHRWFRRSEQFWESTHQCLEQAIRTYKDKARRQCSEHPHYQTSDWVWLAIRDLR